MAFETSRVDSVSDAWCTGWNHQNADMAFDTLAPLFTLRIFAFEMKPSKCRYGFWDTAAVISFWICMVDETIKMPIWLLRHSIRQCFCTDFHKMKPSKCRYGFWDGYWEKPPNLLGTDETIKMPIWLLRLIFRDFVAVIKVIDENIKMPIRQLRLYSHFDPFSKFCRMKPSKCRNGCWDLIKLARIWFMKKMKPSKCRYGYWDFPLLEIYPMSAGGWNPQNAETALGTT